MRMMWRAVHNPPPPPRCHGSVGTLVKTRMPLSDRQSYRHDTNGPAARSSEEAFCEALPLWGVWGC